MADTTWSVIWQDANGRTRQTIFNTLTGANTLETDLQAASNAGILYDWLSTRGPAIGAAAAATYQTTGDSAQLNFITAAGSIVRVTLPAPKLGIFLADAQTVNPANGLVAAIIAAAVGELTDGGGHPVVSYIGGRYSRLKGTDLLGP